MINFDFDAESKSRKLADQIRKLQEEKARLDESLETEKQRLDLARKVGFLVVNEYQGKPFEYDQLISSLADNLIDDFERDFFGLDLLTEDDPRRPRRRGRKKRFDRE